MAKESSGLLVGKAIDSFQFRNNERLNLALRRFKERNDCFMGNLTKRDLVVRISNETGMVQMTVHDVIQRLLDHLMESLGRGQTVELRKFGVFEVKLRKARVGRNPNRPERDVPIPARAVVKFKPGKEMKNKVRQYSSRILGEPRSGPLQEQA